MDRILRLWRAVEGLEVRPSAAVLAGVVGVSRRTVLRDLRSLALAGWALPPVMTPSAAGVVGGRRSAAGRAARRSGGLGEGVRR